MRVGGGHPDGGHPDGAPSVPSSSPSPRTALSCLVARRLGEGPKASDPGLLLPKPAHWWAPTRLHPSPPTPPLPAHRPPSPHQLRVPRGRRVPAGLHLLPRHQRVHLGRRPHHRRRADQGQPRRGGRGLGPVVVEPSGRGAGRSLTDTAASQLQQGPCRGEGGRWVSPGEESSGQGCVTDPQAVTCPLQGFTSVRLWGVGLGRWSLGPLRCVPRKTLPLVVEPSGRGASGLPGEDVPPEPL